HRHRTQRGNINRRLSTVPHPHLAQILLHSIIKRQPQRLLLTEPNRPIHHTVRKLRTRRSKIIPLTWGDLRALLLDILDQTRRWCTTTLDHHRVRREIQALSNKTRNPLSTSTLSNPLNMLQTIKPIPCNRHIRHRTIMRSINRHHQRRRQINFGIIIRTRQNVFLRKRSLDSSSDELAKVLRPEHMLRDTFFATSTNKRRL